MRFPPYLYFRFGKKWLPVGYCRPYASIMLYSRYSRLAHIATGRQLTTVLLPPVQREVNIRRRRSPGVIFCHSEAFALLTCDGNICGFRQTGSGCLSTGSSFARPEVVFSVPDTATPITPSVKEFSPLRLHYFCPYSGCARV